MLLLCRLDGVVGLALLAGAASAQQDPDNLHASVTVATDARRWGLSELDSGAAWRASIDFEQDSGFFVGVSAGNVEYATEAMRTKPRRHRLYGYVGGTLRGQHWSGSVAIAHNAYPDVAFNYDYSELVVTASYRSRVFLTATRTDDLLSLGNGATHVEIATAWPTAWGLELGIGLGRVRTHDLSSGGYTHWNTGLSKVVGRFAIDLRFHATTQNAVTHLGDPARNQWVSSFSYVIAPRSASE